MLWFTAPDWVECAQNPVTGRPFGDSDVILRLTGSSGYRLLCGARNGSPYALLVSRLAAHWEYAVSDFLHYQQELGHNVLCAMDEADRAHALAATAGHPHDERALRPWEPSVLVHSTTPQGWTGILRDGAVRCWRALHAQHADWEPSPIGARLGDPPDFSDYVMFSTGHVAGEIVVLSKQTGRINMDENASYTPGARLYFDAAALARDGLLIRDGAHLKVRQEVPLLPYLLCAITPQQLGLERSTPNEFTRLANAEFAKAHPELPLADAQ